MWLYHVQMLYQNKLNKLLDYILEFTVTVLFDKIKIDKYSAKTDNYYN